MCHVGFPVKFHMGDTSLVVEVQLKMWTIPMCAIFVVYTLCITIICVTWKICHMYIILYHLHHVHVPFASCEQLAFRYLHGHMYHGYYSRHVYCLWSHVTWTICVTKIVLSCNHRHHIYRLVKMWVYMYLDPHTIKAKRRLTIQVNNPCGFYMQELAN
jgi:hypothetical protein